MRLITQSGNETSTKPMGLLSQSGILHPTPLRTITASTPEGYSVQPSLVRDYLD